MPWLSRPVLRGLRKREPLREHFDALNELLDSVTGPLRELALALLERLAEVPVDVIEDALRATGNDADAAADAIFEWALFTELLGGNEDVASWQPQMRALYRAAANRALEQVPGVVQGGLDTFDAAAFRWARTRAAERVVQVDQSTRALVQDYVAAMFAPDGDARRKFLLDRYGSAGTNAAARAIKDTIGLTSKQEQYARNLWNAMDDLAASMASGDISSGSAVDVITDRWKLLRDVRPPKAKDGVWSEAERERVYTEYLARWRSHRATVIAEHEAMLAYVAGQQAGWDRLQAAGSIDVDTDAERWQTSPDERVCQICLPMNGQTRRLGETFTTGDGREVRAPGDTHISCFPGSTPVAPRGTVTGATVRMFDGDLVVIGMAGGLELACTPNHPILTLGGWVPASSLDVGTHVVCDASRELPAVEDGDHENVPARIEDIAEAFINSPAVLAVPVPTTAKDFHGDGVDGDVAVVATDRLLRNDVGYAPVTETFDQLYLKSGLRRDVPLPRLGVFDSLTFRWLPTLRSAVRRRYLASPLLGRHLGPLQSLGLGLGSRRDARVAESVTDAPTANAEMLGDLVLRDPTAIHGHDLCVREVVVLGHRHFSGPVYNLETTAGYYVAGGVISHNCRCDKIIILDHFDTPAPVPEEPEPDPIEDVPAAPEPPPESVRTAFGSARNLSEARAHARELGLPTPPVTTAEWTDHETAKAMEAWDRSTRIRESLDPEDADAVRREIERNIPWSPLLLSRDEAEVDYRRQANGRAGVLAAAELIEMSDFASTVYQNALNWNYANSPLFRAAWDAHPVELVWFKNTPITRRKARELLGENIAENPVHGMSQASGYQWEGTLTMLYDPASGALLTSRDVPGPNGQTTLAWGGAAAAIRHELAHALRLDPRVRRIFRDATTGEADEISDYASSNAHELWAESFATFTDPRYDRERYGDGARRILDRLREIAARVVAEAQREDEPEP